MACLRRLSQGRCDFLASVLKNEEQLANSLERVSHTLCGEELVVFVANLPGANT